VDFAIKIKKVEFFVSFIFRDILVANFSLGQILWNLFNKLNIATYLLTYLAYD